MLRKTIDTTEKIDYIRKRRRTAKESEKGFDKTVS
jgi:hypothetical protein